MFDINIPFTMPVVLAGVQIVLDLVLILIVLFLLKRISAFDQAKLAALITTLKESEKLCERLGRTVAGNAEIADNIESVLKQTRDDKRREEAVYSSHAENVRDKHKQAFALWKQGRTVEDIADITGLARGEVEVITSLAVQTAQGADRMRTT